MESSIGLKILQSTAKSAAMCVCRALSTCVQVLSFEFFRNVDAELPNVAHLNMSERPCPGLHGSTAGVHAQVSWGVHVHVVCTIVSVCVCVCVCCRVPCSIAFVCTGN